jgi:hypothetical protein
MGVGYDGKIGVYALGNVFRQLDVQLVLIGCVLVTHVVKF